MPSDMCDGDGKDRVTFMRKVSMKNKGKNDMLSEFLIII